MVRRQFEAKERGQASVLYYLPKAHRRRKAGKNKSNRKKKQDLDLTEPHSEGAIEEIPANKGSEGSHFIIPSESSQKKDG